MLIAHVTFRVAPGDATKALEILTIDAETVRGMAGNLAFLPFADPTDPGLLGVMHEWETAEDFAAYIAAPAFAAIGAGLKPMMVAPPVSRRFDARLIEA